MQQVQPNAFKQWTTVLAIIALCAGGVTWLQVAPEVVMNPVRNWLQEPEPAPDSQPTTTVAEQPTKVEAKPVAPAPAAPTPLAEIPAPVVKTGITVSYVNVRSGKSTSTAIVANLEAGTVVELRDGSNSTWQAVTYQGKPGYIFKEYLQLQ